MKEKVLVGLSGGVDSAIAAYLLKEQGYDVVCAFMRNWDSAANGDILGNPTNDDEICPQEKDYQDAVAVAKCLDLPLLRVDFIKEYWDDVFTQFLSEYRKGRTPNPDILCNKYIKFSSFYEFMKKQGISLIATGHYARIQKKDGKHYMLKGLDLNKDQSYFLCQINKDVLQHTLFPVGEIDKPTVRRLAEELNLPIAKKKDSTGICFIGERNFRQFLQNYLPAKPGNIVDVDTRKVMGQHEGVLYYTIGQRKGLNIGGEGGPWFVVGKDVERNELYVAAREDNPWLVSDRCLVSDVNWLIDEIPQGQHECCAKFRYRQKDNPVVIERLENGDVMVTYSQGVAAVTPGQQAVFYDGDVCIGGGTIEATFYHDVNQHERIREAMHGNRK
ncbi:MAG: tRNA 2-thiouridine(34) synthase MnmA [Erysipelotrichaceae bacterium]|nr:tRNA 2-thiouridine(34) synthase MnmA [Erysipelotrichaceae bacterium]